MNPEENQYVEYNMVQIMLMTRVQLTLFIVSFFILINYVFYLIASEIQMMSDDSFDTDPALNANTL